MELAELRDEASTSAPENWEAHTSGKEAPGGTWEIPWPSHRIRFSKLTLCCICWRSSVSRFAYLRLISSEE